MKYFEEILKNLSTVPTPEYPGRIIVSGASQAVLIAPDNQEVIIAACSYKKGKLIAFAHDAYLDWIQNPTNQMKKFSENVMMWLTGKVRLAPKEVIKTEMIEKMTDLRQYKLVIWNHLDKLDKSYEEKFRNYLVDGGAIACGSCPWGYLQLRPSETLKDMQLNNFLKDYGMLYTPECLYISSWIKTENNQAHKFDLCNFDNALRQLGVEGFDNEINYHQCVLTLTSSFSHLKCRNLLTPDEKSMINKIVESTLIKIKPDIPSESEPVCKSSSKKKMNIFAKCLNTSEQKAPGIEEFPGDFPDCRSELLQDVELNLKTKFHEALSTGYYLPAGVELIINVKEISSSLSNWVVRVGAHTDDLTNCDSISRWPCLIIEQNLNSRTTLTSPYGGLVYLLSPQSDGITSIKLTMSNVVASPYYDLTRPDTLQSWKTNRESEGLWAELAGETIVFTTPSKCVRHIDNPRIVLEFWDKVVRGHHQLRGTNASDFKRERVVNDLQPSVGYMHSGYPIVTCLDCCQRDHEECLFDINKLMKNGNWGLFHEIGHNMQRDQWTFDGAVEVTVNFFSMHVYHHLFEQKLHDIRWLRQNIKEISEYLDSINKANISYKKWQTKYGVGLYTFALLIKRFGWASMYKFLRDYEEDINNNHESLPVTNTDKIDQWVIRYSNIVGYNLKKHFEKFGLPVSDQVDKKIKHLRAVHIDTDPEKFFN